MRNDDLIKSPYFKMKIKSTLKDNMLKRRVGSKLTGTLSGKHLYKAITNGRCFSKKDSIGDKKYNIVLLYDCSGSMHGSRLKLAAQSIAQMYEDLSDIVNLKVLGFNKKVITLIDWEDSFNPDNWQNELYDKARRFMNQTGGDNVDGGAIYQATQDLKKKHGENIIIVFSDGQPTCNRMCPAKKECDRVLGTDWYVKDADGIEQPKYEMCVKHYVRIARNKGITLFGIGIESKHVKQFYRNYAFVYNLKNLHKALMTLLTMKIKRKTLKTH